MWLPPSRFLLKSNKIKGNRKCYPNVVHTVGLLLSCKAFQVRNPEDIVRWEASEAYQVENSLSGDWLTEQLSIAQIIMFLSTILNRNIWASSLP